MSLPRAYVLSVLLVPALALGAAEKAVPTKSNPPPVGVSGSYLIDKTIPAYGVQNQVPHFTDSRANALYLEIHQVLADVESQVMAGHSAPAADAKNAKKKKDEGPAPVGDARIGELLNRLVELDAHIAYRTYLEQWHLDTSFSDLNRATELLAMNGQVGGATVEKVQGAKAKADTKPAAAKPDAPAAPAAPAAKPEAPAPVPAPEAPAAPAAPVPAPEAPAAPAAPVPAPEAPAAPAAPAEAPAAPAAPAAPVEAPAAPAAPAEAPAAPAAPAAPEAAAPAAPAAPELPAAEPPADKPAADK